MAKSVKGTLTEKNLLASFAGESQARNRYTFMASKAKKEGLVQISQIFAETANQEKEHAERFFSFLEGGVLEIEAGYPAGFAGGLVGDTAENLAHAAGGENEEWSILYPAMAKTAREEGFPVIAALWEAVCVAEKQHEKRYLDLLANLKAGRVFKRDEPVVWRCINCGYLHEGAAAPDFCPACAHPQAYYEILGENW